MLKLAKLVIIFSICFVAWIQTPQIVLAAAACGGQLSGNCTVWTCGNGVFGPECIESGSPVAWETVCQSDGSGGCEIKALESSCVVNGNSCSIIGCRSVSQACGGGGGGACSGNAASCTNSTQCCAPFECDTTAGVNQCKLLNGNGGCARDKCNGNNTCTGPYYSNPDCSRWPGDCCRPDECSSDADCTGGGENTCDIVAPSVVGVGDQFNFSVSVLGYGPFFCQSKPPFAGNCHWVSGTDCSSGGCTGVGKSDGAGSCTISIDCVATGTTSCNRVVNMVQSDLYIAANSFKIPDGLAQTSTTANLTVCNKGSTALTNVAVGFSRTGIDISCVGANQPGQTETIAKIFGNSCRPMSFNFNYPPGVGQKTAWAMVDSSCSINESDETNNKATADYDVLAACSGAFVTITNSDNSCSGKLGLTISGGFNMGQNNINSNQQYTINFTSGGSYAVIPTSANVPSTCSGEAGPIDIRCSDVQSFFETFGGDVMAKGRFSNAALPLGEYVSGDIVGQLRSAGAVVAKTITPINAGGGKFSSQNSTASQGWNVLYDPQTPDPDLSKADYDSLLSAVLAYGGMSDPSEVCGVPGNTVGPIRGVLYKCYNGTGNVNFNQGGSPPDTLILIPNGPSNPSINSNLALNQKVILFVDGDLDVRDDMSLTGANSAFVAIVKGAISVRADDTSRNTVRNMDGLYIGETINTGPSALDDLKGNGMMIGRSNVTLGRQIPNAPGETWTFEPKYLDFFKNLLSVPKASWNELSPE